MSATYPKLTAPDRICPTCGELLFASRCPECSPIEPARAYGDRVTQPMPHDASAISVGIAPARARHRTGEWILDAETEEPHTRRAHPIMVRAALAEAEERARDRIARTALVPSIATRTRMRTKSVTTAPQMRRATPPPLPHDALRQPSRPAAEHKSGEPQVASMVAAPSAPMTSAITKRGVTRPLEPAPQLASLPHIDTSGAFDPPESVPNRRVTMFWLALLATALALVLIGAL